MINFTITHIRYNSVPNYLQAIREKAVEFGKLALTSYCDPKSLVIGFKCKNEIHLIGMNNIRGYYNIERTLPNFPTIISFKTNKKATVSQAVGIDMFMNDCRKALNGDVL